ncbi:MAG: response regulator [Nitrospiraceae bacterium]
MSDSVSDSTGETGHAVGHDGLSPDMSMVAVADGVNQGPPTTPWERFKTQAALHIDTLETAATALIEGQAASGIVPDAYLGARSLEQAFTTRGLYEGARVARDLAKVLDGANMLFPPQLLQICELIVQLESELGQAAKPMAIEAGRDAEGPLVVVVARDRSLATRLMQAPSGRSFHAVWAEFPNTVGDLLAGAAPTAAVLDLHAGDSVERGLLLLDEFSNHVPPIPVVVLLHHDAMRYRLEVARRGARMAAPIDLPLDALADAVAGVVALVRASAPKVLAVDNDPTVLGTVGSVLDARGLDVTTLGDSSRFWDVFNQNVPDMVVAAAEMAPVTGLELCRGIRDDPFWRLMPVVMLTGQNDAVSIERVFAAGADDCVAKPVVGPELIARIANRLERFYLQRQQAGTDGLTGVASRPNADHHVRRLIRMAARSRLPLTLVALDVDGLGEINRLHGIPAGDAVLRRLGQILLRTLRAEDAVVRLGGDEFIVAMYNARKQDAVLRIQTVLDSLAQESFPELQQGALTPRFSAAVVQYLLEGSDLQWLHDAAGQLLAQIKAAGGGQILAAIHESADDQDEAAYDVAIVEEDESVASLMHRALMTQGVRPIWIRDGETAVHKLSGATPIVRAKVIVLELDLPGLDGMAVLRRLSDDHVLTKTKVIVLTNRANEDEVVAAFETGAFDYVAKPFSIRVLTQRIRRAL